MSKSLYSLTQSGTKLWLDSIDPDLILQAKKEGATGATSNPIIIAELIKTGRFDGLLKQYMQQDMGDEQIAWKITDHLVKQAQDSFLPIWERASANDGYVSFELDPLIEDAARALPLANRVKRYVESGKQWAAGHKNRMIKVPATPAGLASLEDLSAAGVPLNVTLIFTPRQYQSARDAIWRGAQRLPELNRFKSVYSIFVSRVDVYTEQHCPDLSEDAQGLVGILNAQRIWKMNQEFWADKNCDLQQEIVFASTGTKKDNDLPWKYVAALAGSDIQTNPPGTNQKIAQADVIFDRRVHQLPPTAVVEEIDRIVDWNHLETTLMEEGIDKFASPQHGLLDLIKALRD